MSPSQGEDREFESRCPLHLKRKGLYMQCPKCKEEISDNSKFCSNCGTNIKEYLEKLEDEKYIKCPNCDKKIEKDAKFCKYCGHNIIKEVIKNVQRTKSFNKLGNHIAIATVLVIIFVSFSIVILNVKEYYYPESHNTEYQNLELEPTPQPRANIEVVNSHLVNMGYGMQKIEGIVKNTSNITCYNPDIEIHTFDSSGNRIGEEPILIMNALNPGETYKFTIYANGASRYGIEKCNCGY